MMRRRAVPVRRGPGVVGTVARTAAIAGTATVASHAVGGAMDRSAQQKQEQAQQQAMAAQQAQQTQADTQQLQAQIAQLQAQQLQMQQQQTGAQPQPAPQGQPVVSQGQPAAPQVAPQGGGADLMAQLQQLQHLKEAGILTEEEFTSAKAKLLAS